MAILYVQILPLLTDYHDVISAVRSFLCTLFTVYVAQGTLQLQLDRLTHPAKHSLASVVQEVLTRSTMDEHTFKLIQVCSDMYKETTDPALRNIYTWAACTALNHPLSFGWPDSTGEWWFNMVYCFCRRTTQCFAHICTTLTGLLTLQLQIMLVV